MNTTRSHRPDLFAVPSQAAQPTPQRCVNEQGFSLHAEVCCAAHQRKTLESQAQGRVPERQRSWPGPKAAVLGAPRMQHLCRYITRPAIANDRLTLNRAGQVVLTLKTPYRDGTTHIVMSPLEFMQRLAALIPRPRLHLIRFHGVLAPNARLRPEIIPSSGRQAGAVPVPGFPGVPVNANTPYADHGDAPPPLAPPRMSWARLLKRLFEIDIEQCPRCGGPLNIIAAIVDPTVIAKILTHLGLPARAPPRSPPRLFDRLQIG